MSEVYVLILTRAVLCEAVVEWGNTIVPALAGRGAAGASLVVGLVLAFGARQDWLALFWGASFCPKLVRSWPAP